jgi:aminopeptidase-like protein
MRSKYGEYPEYHTSLDDLTFVTPAGLEGGYEALRRAIEVIERNARLQCTILCEPQLGKRGLYPTLSSKGSGAEVRLMMNLIAYCDGTKSLLEVAEAINEPFWNLVPVAERLIEHALLKDLDGVFAQSNLAAQ